MAARVLAKPAECLEGFPVSKASLIMSALSVGAALLAAAPTAAQDVSKGRDTARRYCAACHAIGEGQSPLQDAPPFARLQERYGAGGLAELLEKGMIKDRPHPLDGKPRLHPRMPAFVLSDDEVVALAAYLRTFERPPEDAASRQR
jgi:mono/diheme cytochrome c family protein